MSQTESHTNPTKTSVSRLTLAFLNLSQMRAHLTPHITLHLVQDISPHLVQDSQTYSKENLTKEISGIHSERLESSSAYLSHCHGRALQSSYLEGGHQGSTDAFERLLWQWLHLDLPRRSTFGPEIEHVSHLPSTKICPVGPKTVVKRSCMESLKRGCPQSMPSVFRKKPRIHL